MSSAPLNNQPSYYQSAIDTAKEAGKQVISGAAGIASGVIAGYVTAVGCTVASVGYSIARSNVAHQTGRVIVKAASGDKVLAVLLLTGTVIVTAVAAINTGVGVRNEVYKRL